MLATIKLMIPLFFIDSRVTSSINGGGSKIGSSSSGGLGRGLAVAFRFGLWKILLMKNRS
jgi:hypothetical protein